MSKNSQPLVSVIVPTFNRVQQLGETLAGIASQTFTDLELVVVDDGSDEDVASRIETLHGDSSIEVRTLRLSRSNPDGNGPAFVRNEGVRYSRGELLAFCDDDDFWNRADHLEIAAKCFAEDAELDYFFANQRARRNARPAYDNWLPSLTRRIATRRPFADSCYEVQRAELLAEGHFPHLNTTVVRREFFDRIEGFRSDLRCSEDLDFFVRAADAARKMVFRNEFVSVHNIPDPTIASHASTRFNWRERRVVVAAIADQLRLCCESKEAQAYACRVQGMAYKDLATTLAAEGRWHQALRFAKLAGALQPTWRWRGYTTMLRFRRWFG